MPPWAQKELQSSTLGAEESMVTLMPCLAAWRAAADPAMPHPITSRSVSNSGLRNVRWDNGTRACNKEKNEEEGGAALLSNWIRSSTPKVGYHLYRVIRSANFNRLLLNATHKERPYLDVEELSLIRRHTIIGI